MENLQVVNATTTTTAKETILDDLVEYSFISNSEMPTPTVVNFTVRRNGKDDSANNGNVAIFGAFYMTSKKLDTNNHSWRNSDAELYKAIVLTCEKICTPKEII